MYTHIYRIEPIRTGGQEGCHLLGNEVTLVVILDGVVLVEVEDDDGEDDDDDDDDDEDNGGRVVTLVEMVLNVVDALVIFSVEDEPELLSPEGGSSPPSHLPHCGWHPFAAEQCASLVPHQP
jgi:hypothetical protein